jgi:hypothetical protein
MPMIDVYATAGTFTDKHQLAIDLATTVMKIEAVQREWRYQLRSRAGADERWRS